MSMPAATCALDDRAHRAVHFRGHGRRVDGLAGLAADQQVGQHLVARQAADVRGQDAIAAVDHGRLPGVQAWNRDYIVPDRATVMPSPLRPNSEELDHQHSRYVLAHLSAGLGVTKASVEGCGGERGGERRAPRRPSARATASMRAIMRRPTPWSLEDFMDEDGMTLSGPEAHRVPQASDRRRQQTPCRRPCGADSSAEKFAAMHVDDAQADRPWHSCRRWRAGHSSAMAEASASEAARMTMLAWLGSHARM